MSKYPSIPDPTPGSPNADVLSALKQTVEMIVGYRTAPVAPHVRLFRGNIAPGATQSTIKQMQLRDGDLWIDTSQVTGQLKYFDADRVIWVPVK
jgi:hypothetical protein